MGIFHEILAGALFRRGGDWHERGSTGAGIFEPWSALSRGWSWGWDASDAKLLMLVGGLEHDFHFSIIIVWE